ncbi:RxLR effector protein [Phytophthora megakarya]|uniref:RxLR effector protein n=1 Tax=Phytophthora megakarya TaxID=4795 RepID=A0A225W577_9STRA|nr:RxLR effector protein [Phytophthora megakarya]
MLTGEDKRFLRSHENLDGDSKLRKHEDGEREYNLLGALKLQRAQKDNIYRFKLFGRWKRHGLSASDVEKHVPEGLYDAYVVFRRMNDK